MANKEQMRQLDNGVEEWNQWRSENPSIPIDLSHTKLIGWFLSGANLAQANLEGTDLSGASLHQANLSGANLKRTQCLGADLSQAIVSHANLE